MSGGARRTEARAGAVVLALLLAAACGGEPPPQHASADAPSAIAAPPLRSERLVLAMVVDQLAAWHAKERLDKLPVRGGFARILGGAASAELRLGYVQTSTSMGHTALFTGLSPRDSGITLNGRFSPEGRYVPVIADPATKIVGAAGATEQTGSSLSALRGETLADALKRQRPTLWIGALSMKDRGTVFAAGRTPDAALWFDSRLDAFVTSTAFGARIPAFAQRFAEPGLSARYATDPWLPADPRWLASVTDLPAPELGQGDLRGLGARFPHDLRRVSEPARAFSFTPFADVAEADLAIAALDAIPADREALLSISWSAYDYVAHVFGPDAPEAWDELLRLDGQIARVLDRADSLWGEGRYGVVLSSDHGGPPTPEVMNQGFCGRPDPDPYERRCERARRLVEGELAKLAQEAAVRAVGEGRWVRGVDEPFVELTPEARALPPDKRERLGRALEDALRAVPGIQRVVSVLDAPASCPGLDDMSLDALICRSVSGTSGGDLLLVPAPGSFFETGYVDGKGENHGTPWLYDRAVPLLVRPAGPFVPTAKSLRFEPKSVVDQRAFAASVAGLFELEPPAGARGGRDLSSGAR